MNVETEPTRQRTSRARIAAALCGAGIVAVALSASGRSPKASRTRPR